jgi:drug/metabolite transporter (DMT)-like permease
VIQRARALLPVNRAAQGVLVMALAVATLSSGTTIVKWGHTEGTIIAFWRLLAATAAWWIVLAIRRTRRGVPWPSRATWRAMVPAGLFFGADISVIFIAVNKTSIAHAEFISSLTPLIVVPLGAALFHERPNPRALPFAAVAIAGLALVLGAGGNVAGTSIEGDALVVVAVCLWAGYLVCSRMARATVGVVDFMATVVPLGLIVVIPAVAIRTGGDLLPPDGRGWGSIFLLTIVTGMLGHCFIAIAQRLVDVGTISVIGVAQPAIAVCWAWLVLGEPIKATQLPGMAVLLAGLIGFTLLQQRGRPVVTAICESEPDLVPEPVTGA